MINELEHKPKELYVNIFLTDMRDLFTVNTFLSSNSECYSFQIYKTE